MLVNNIERAYHETYIMSKKQAYRLLMSTELQISVKKQGSSRILGHHHQRVHMPLLTQNLKFHWQQ